MIGCPKLIEEVASHTGMSKAEIIKAVSAYIKELTDKLVAGNDVQLWPDFGFFVVCIAGGKEIQYTKQRKTVLFKTAKALQTRLRQTDKE